MLDQILLDRLEEYITTNEIQFGFKAYQGPDLCVCNKRYTVVSKYKRQNTTLIVCFLETTKAFDHINHGKARVRPFDMHFIHWCTEQTIKVRWGKVIPPYVSVCRIKSGAEKDDVLMRMCNTNAQANMLARTFHMCSADVKIALFRAYSMQHTSGGIIETAKWTRLRLHTVTPYKL